MKGSSLLSSVHSVFVFVKNFLEITKKIFFTFDNQSWSVARQFYFKINESVSLPNWLPIFLFGLIFSLMRGWDWHIKNSPRFPNSSIWWSKLNSKLSCPFRRWIIHSSISPDNHSLFFISLHPKIYGWFPGIRISQSIHRLTLLWSLFKISHKLCEFQFPICSLF